MAEQEAIFSTKLRYTGVFSFSEFYLFCFDWLADETSLFLNEDKYKEKIEGTTKNLEIKWKGFREITDYFKFKVEVTIMTFGLTKVEVTKHNQKIKMNKGTIEMKIKGTLIRDYKGKFESTAFKKFLRAIYERWIIPSRIEEFEGKLISDCNEFMSQAKAFLDVEAKS